MYINEVNKELERLLPHYLGLFSRSGLVATFGKEFIKGIVESFDKKHAFNNINCESHRWAIQRALRLKYNL